MINKEVPTTISPIMAQSKYCLALATSCSLPLNEPNIKRVPDITMASNAKDAEMLTRIVNILPIIVLITLVVVAFELVVVAFELDLIGSVNS